LFLAGAYAGYATGGIALALKWTGGWCAGTESAATMMAVMWPKIVQRRGAYFEPVKATCQRGDLSQALRAYYTVFTVEAKTASRFRVFTWLWMIAQVAIAIAWIPWLGLAGGAGFGMGRLTANVNWEYFAVYSCSDLCSAAIPLLAKFGPSAIEKCQPGMALNFLKTLDTVGAALPAIEAARRK
jgi:hypothetical protein